MKVIVVDDCAYVMSDIIPFLDSDINVQFLCRSRGLWSKTFGVAWKIYNTKGDLVHCNYALQNAWLTNKLSHLDILHCHGSDIRWALQSKKYGWLVRSGLSHAGKVLYATPDLAEKVKQFRRDAIYVPTPVDTVRFGLKNSYSQKGKLKALYFKQSYESVFPLEAYHEKFRDFSFEMKMIQNRLNVTIRDRNVSYEQMPMFLRQFDVFIDRFSIPSLSKTALEAMSCGLDVIDFRHTNSLNNLCEKLDSLDCIQDVGLDNRCYIENNHNVRMVAKQLSEIYREEVDKNGVT